MKKADSPRDVYKVPEWTINAVVYQIVGDRFDKKQI